jgi:hypothetical protein
MIVRELLIGESGDVEPPVSLCGKTLTGHLVAPFPSTDVHYPQTMERPAVGTDSRRELAAWRGFRIPCTDPERGR